MTMYFELEKSYRTEQERWDALVRRDPLAGDAFRYAVRTTGVYCRPGCSSRLPNRQSVQFFETALEAEQAGYRPCKRCDPAAPLNDRYTDVIARACQWIEAAEKPPRLRDLAQRAGFSPYHFHRLFKRLVGITPKQYYLEKRLKHVRARLREEETVTGAVYAAGFGSGSQFYQKSAETLGMKPSVYQKGGQGMKVYYTVAQSYLGWVLVAATEQGICAIDFGGSAEELKSGLADHFPQAECIEGGAEFQGWVESVLAFLESPRHGSDLPLDIQGTAFQRRVWAALREIPPGQTVSYTELAERIGSPNAVRAVARACASNKIAALIPCHRVVRADGALAGYRWGIERKRMLLDREKV